MEGTNQKYDRCTQELRHVNVSVVQTYQGLLQLLRRASEQRDIGMKYVIELLDDLDVDVV